MKRRLLMKAVVLLIVFSMSLVDSFNECRAPHVIENCHKVFMKMQGVIPSFLVYT